MDTAESIWALFGSIEGLGAIWENATGQQAASRESSVLGRRPASNITHNHRFGGEAAFMLAGSMVAERDMCPADA